MLTTYPYASHILKWKQVGYTPTKGEIKIEDDVWICHGSLILSGVTIGKGSVIGAGSIVTKDIPPYSIFANGRVIRKRFNEDIIDTLIKLDLSKIKTMDKEKQDYLMTHAVDKDNIDMISGMWPG